MPPTCSVFLHVILGVKNGTVRRNTCNYNKLRVVTLSKFQLDIAGLQRNQNITLEFLKSTLLVSFHFSSRIAWCSQLCWMYFNSLDLFFSNVIPTFHQLSFLARMKFSWQRTDSSQIFDYAVKVAFWCGVSIVKISSWQSGNFWMLYVLFVMFSHPRFIHFGWKRHISSDVILDWHEKVSWERTDSSQTSDWAWKIPYSIRYSCWNNIFERN